MNQASAAAKQRQVCLHLMSRLRDFQQNGHLCDLTLELRNQKFHVHKVVLSAWSPVIYNLLKEGKNPHEVIQIQYDNAEIFRSFLTFLYTGQMDDVARLNVIQILHLATSFQIHELREVCEEILKKMVQIDNIISTCHVAKKFCLPNLEQHALDFMQLNLHDAVQQNDFLSMCPPRFRGFLSCDSVGRLCPEVKLYLIISWLGFDVKQRQPFLMLLLQFIDWSIVAETFLSSISQTENFFTANESSLYLLLQTLDSSKISLGPYRECFRKLRAKYVYLLNDVVDVCDLPIDKEEYFPVSVSLITAEVQAQDKETLVSGNRNELSGVSWDDQQVKDSDCSIEENLDEESFCPSDPHDISNDSISSGMKKVAVMESYVSATERRASLALNESLDSNDEGTHYSSRVMDQLKHEDDVSTTPLESSGSSPKMRKTAQKRKRTAGSQQRRKSESLGKTRAFAKGRRKKAEQEDLSDVAVESKPWQNKSDISSHVSASQMTTDLIQDNDSNNAQPSRQSKRQVAVKCSVLEKQVPHPHKTKALLKEVTAPEAVSEEITEQNQEDKLADMHEKVSSACDSDDDGNDDNEVMEDDSNTDPDYSLPAKRSRSARLSSRKLSTPKKTKTKSKASRNNEKGKGANRSRKTKSDSSLNEKQVDASEERLRLKDTLQTVTPSQSSEAEPTMETCQNMEGKKSDGNKGVRENGQSRKKCHICEYSATTQHRLDNHIERVHGSRATLYACSLCSFECQWSKGFYEHMKQHFQGPPFACDHDGCGFETQRIQLLLFHRRRHTDERHHKCPHCSVRFRTRNNLIAHFKCHSEEKDHECPICHRRFRMKNTMEQHMVTHSDARPYLCDLCGFSTKFQSHLISHKRTHTGEVFCCTFSNCQYSSPKRSQLKAHLRSHLNIRRHTCDICQSSFIEKSHLVRHIKIHQNSRPYQCDECQYSSTRIDKVNEHKRKYHGEEADSKRPYKYTPRSKKGKSKKTSLKTETPQQSPSLVPVTATTGLPIRPKPTQQTPMTAFIETLVSAAEEVSVTLPAVAVTQRQADQRVEVSGEQRVCEVAENVATTGQAVELDRDRNKGNLGVGVGYVGVAPEKSEANANPYVFVDLANSSLDHGRATTASHAFNTIGTAGFQGGRNPVILQEGRSVTDCQPSSTQLTPCNVLQDQSYHHSNTTLSQTSTALLQHSAASVPSVVASQSSCQLVNAVPQGVMLLPQTATPDVQEASHILVSVRQQHNADAVSAAGSLACLSFGLGPQTLPGQPDAGSLACECVTSV